MHYRDILQGKVNPSGKLPMTFPIHLNDHASNANFPLDGEPLKIAKMLFKKELPDEKKVRNKDFTRYDEGIYIGYRHFDKADIAVSYPFGYGLSYTNFELSNVDLAVEGDTIDIKVNVTNLGEKKGKEVVQIYVSKPDSKIDRPLKELKAFAKTQELVPGEMVELFLQIPVSDLRYWDETTSGWALEKGIYEIQAGTSSRNIDQSLEIEI